jgi:P27 family predicted phage terminase small subunit
MLTAMDLPMLRLLAEAQATEREMVSVLEREGLTIAAGSGGRKAHPALRAGAAARTTAIRLLEAFGMPPASRQRVDQAPLPATLMPLGAAAGLAGRPIGPVDRTLDPARPDG